MVTGGNAPKRNRFSFALPKSRFEWITRFFHRGEIWGRILICVLAMVAIWLGTGAWTPPFPYRTRFVPQREIVARTDFEYENETLTREKQAIAVSGMRCIYTNDPAKINLAEARLKEKLFAVIDSKEEFDLELAREFFFEERSATNSEEIETKFKLFEKELEADPRLEALTPLISQIIEPYRRRGLLQSLQHEVVQGLSTSIMVVQKNDSEDMTVVEVNDVRIAVLLPSLIESVKRVIKPSELFSDVDLVADRIAEFLYANFSETLKLDVERTSQRRDKVRSEVPIEKRRYKIGDRLSYEKGELDRRNGIVAGVALDEADVRILRAEHDAYLRGLNATEKLIYSVADFGLYTAVFLLCGAFIYYRERKIIREFGRFSLVLASFVLTIVATWMIDDSWRAEVVPISLFSMVISIAYRHEVAWILGACASLVVTYSMGMGLTDFVIFVSAVTTGSYLCNDISSRTRLFYAGLFMAVVTFATAIGAGILAGQAPSWDMVVSNQVLLAAWFAFCAFLSGLLITVFLPFVEKLFDVQTDLTLLEWSDPSHELLHKMIQRAPGTYNHSINVASIAENAADSIGANGLLCRVAAYYHDIGKILKPEYFVENQTAGQNKHDSLVPAMSSIVIIAHVKDGVELARKHRLPECMIDMIEQHHGSTMVEYFYRQAVKEAKESGSEEEVDESNFRYPGPKPQTKEACVMMLSDAVESACRTLTEPAPARIESLVKEISAKRLNDDQFSECPLTLKELHMIEQSLIKSLISVYHSRIKYQEQPGE